MCTACIGSGVCAVQWSEPWGLAPGGVWRHPQAPGEAEERGGDSERPRWGTHPAAPAPVCGEGPASGHCAQVCVCVYDYSNKWMDTQECDVQNYQLCKKMLTLFIHFVRKLKLARNM